MIHIRNNPFIDISIVNYHHAGICLLYPLTPRYKIAEQSAYEIDAFNPYTLYGLGVAYQDMGDQVNATVFL